MHDDGLCYYCQKDFRSRRRLINHLRSEHVGTHAYYNIGFEGVDDAGD